MSTGVELWRLKLVLELTPSLVMIDYDDTRIQLSPIASRVADLSNFRKMN